MNRPFFNWVAAMRRVDRARVALRNFLFDRRVGRVPRDLVERFLEFVEREWKPDTTEPDEIVRSFALSDPDKCFCQGRPEPKRPRRAGCSRVLDAKTFWHENLIKDAGGFELDNGDIPEAEIRRLERLGLHGLTQGEMRSRAPFAWVTWTGRVDRLRKTIAEQKRFAAELRDHLGLTSYTKGQRLVEVRYPAKTVKTMYLAPPTFVEGSPGTAYVSATKKDGWGRTRHLKTRQEAFPEAVHRPVEFTGEFHIRYAGHAWISDEDQVQ